MLEYEEESNYSTEKYNAFIDVADKHISDIKRVASIIHQLETNEDLSLSDKDLLKAEFGEIVDNIKSDSSDMVDALVTEYQLYNATAPRVSQDLSGFKLLQEKIVDKNRNQPAPEELQNDEDFYYNSSRD